VNFTSPGGISKLSKQILKVVPLVPLEVIEETDISGTDLIVTVDTNTLQQLGTLRNSIMNSGKPLVMIDHHAPHPESTKTASFVLCEEQSTSTCEMILDMFESSHIKPGKVVSQALLVGILVETGHFSIATRRTFEHAYSLIRSGAKIERALAVTRSEMDESERIARVKSAQRLRLERVSKWLIALSEIGSYHASAARALIALGAHLAVVAGKRNDELTVSLRATRDFVSETGIHLGTDLANPLGLRMGGMGGGHATAAGANMKGDVNEALRLSLTLVREFISRSPKSNTEIPKYPQASSQTEVTTQN
jgi:nanoRNase/pAp phosphatase (c-di-AMP/oligoRNAs hydrolase)